MTAPLVSICIPQYNRSRYLLEVLRSAVEQTYPRIELCVSDDASQDDTDQVVPPFLETCGRPYVYRRQPRNLGYDKNLRAALALGTGDYLFILGNDDALADPHAIADFVRAVEEHGRPEVVLTNSCAAHDRTEIARRAHATRAYPAGRDTAIEHYRAFSFVAGIALQRDAFAANNDAGGDGSVFVQAYLGLKILASGGRLLTFDRVMVAAGIQVDERVANSYKDILRRAPMKITPNSQGVGAIARVAAEILTRDASPEERTTLLRRIYRPLLTRTYPYWLYAHRKEGFHTAALAMALGCWPPILLRDVPHARRVSVGLLPVYLAVTLGGLVLPTRVLGRLAAWRRGPAAR